MEPSGQNDEFGRRVFDQFMDLFVTPEVKRRFETGKSREPFSLRAAQVIFFPDGRRPQVRLNSEIRAIGKVKLKQGISKKAGEPTYEHEVEGLNEVNLTAEDDPDCGHATLVRIGDSWTIAFDFRYNKALSRKHIVAARQFLESAEFSLSKKNLSPFADNLFSAAELVAKSILLSMSDPRFRRKATHRAIQNRFNRFASLGNVKPVYRETFNRLSVMRDQARYLKGDVSISEDECRRLLDIVRSMMEEASHRVGIR